jgi:hypothetical protein
MSKLEVTYGGHVAVMKSTEWRQLVSSSSARVVKRGEPIVRHGRLCGFHATCGGKKNSRFCVGKS